MKDLYNHDASATRLPLKSGLCPTCAKLYLEAVVLRREDEDEDRS